MSACSTFISLSGVVFACALAAGPAAEKAPEFQEFKVGDATIRLPPPGAEFIEVRDAKRKSLETFAGPNSRLVAAYLLAADVPELKEGGKLLFSRYALVQAYRPSENRRCGAAEFQAALDGMEKSLGDMGKVIKETDAELNRRLKALDLGHLETHTGEVKQLGCMFSRPDARGYGTINTITTAGQTRKMACLMALARVQGKVLFFYFWADYENEGTVTGLRNACRAWCDAILAANK